MFFIEKLGCKLPKCIRHRPDTNRRQKGEEGFISKKKKTYHDDAASVRGFASFAHGVKGRHGPKRCGCRAPSRVQENESGIKVLVHVRWIMVNASSVKLRAPARCKQRSVRQILSDMGCASHHQSDLNEENNNHHRDLALALGAADSTSTHTKKAANLEESTGCPYLYASALAVRVAGCCEPSRYIVYGAPAGVCLHPQRHTRRTRT